LLPVFQSEVLNVAALVMIALWFFPTWAHRMLQLKERWDDHRRG
jgi:hypothetical protein